MSETVRESIKYGRLPVTLVAGGSAAGYLIDAVQQHRDMRSMTPLTILYTARDTALFHWVVEVLAPLLTHIAMYSCHVVLALTDDGMDHALLEEVVAEKQQEVNALWGCNTSIGVAGSATHIDELDQSGIRLQHGRINFAEEIPEGNIVFFQGSGGLQSAVEKEARSRRCRMVTGPSFDNDNPRKNIFLAKLKLTAFKNRGSAV